jgi:hypothetical protein
LKYDAVQSGTHFPTFRSNVLPRSYTTNMEAYLSSTVIPDGILRVKNVLAKSVYYVTELII